MDSIYPPPNSRITFTDAPSTLFPTREDSNLICYIHSCTLPAYGTTVLSYLLKVLIDSGLIFDLQTVVVINIGEAIAAKNLFESTIPDNLIVINSDASAAGYELGTLRSMHHDANLHPEMKILYLHTKGISHSPTSPEFGPIQDWNNFMLYGLVHRFRECVKLLDSISAIGSNYMNEILKRSDIPRHFSGNFWWARAKYVRTLPVREMKTAHDAEWLIFRNNPTFFSIHNSRVHHYATRYKPEEYMEIVNFRLSAAIRILTEFPPILYGAGETWIDISSICYRKCWYDGILHLPIGDEARNVLFSDPCFGVKKVIRIGELDLPYTEDWMIPYQFEK